MSQDFLQYIPHRPPFLFVDKVTEETQDSIKAEKSIDPKAPFFQGHYPDRPIMPGVLIFESIFQTGAIMMGKRIAKKGRIPVLTRVNNIKLKHFFYFHNLTVINFFKKKFFIYKYIIFCNNITE